MRMVKLHSYVNKQRCTWEIFVQIMQLPSAATPTINIALVINIYLYYSIERKHIKETNDFASFSIHTAIRSVSFGSLPPSISCSQPEHLQTRCYTTIKYWKVVWKLTYITWVLAASCSAVCIITMCDLLVPDAETTSYFNICNVPCVIQ